MNSFNFAMADDMEKITAKLGDGTSRTPTGETVNNPTSDQNVEDSSVNVELQDEEKKLEAKYLALCQMGRIKEAELFRRAAKARLEAAEN